MPGPASFTGEDVAELHVHGSPAVIAEVLARSGSIKGLRPAEAGEFTRRAFRNGRMDLVEAEGLGDLIRARTTAQRRQALDHMRAWRAGQYEAWRRMLVECLARVEAAVDFLEEEDVAAEGTSGCKRASRGIARRDLPCGCRGASRPGHSRGHQSRLRRARPIPASRPC